MPAKVSFPRRASCALAVAAALTVGVAIIPLRAAAYTAWGAGIHSCGAYSAERRNRIDTDMQEWALGFFAGAAAYASQDALRNTDSSGALAWLDNYCFANPTTKFMDAIQQFISTQSP